MSAAAKDDAIAADAVSTRTGPRWWAVVSVSVALGLLYAWDLFEAISNLLGVAQLNALAAEAEVDPIVPWALPITAVALPVLVFVVASLVARGRGLGMRVLLLVAGLAVVAAVTSSLTALA